MQHERSGVRKLPRLLLGGACVLAACVAAAQTRPVEPRPVEIQSRPIVRDLTRLAPRDCTRPPKLPEPTLAAARSAYVKGGPFELRQVTPETSRLARGTILRLESGPLAGNRCWVDLWVSAGPFARLPFERVTPMLQPDREKPDEPPTGDDVGPAETPTGTVPEQPPAREVDCKALPALPEPTLAAARKVYAAQRRFEIRRVTPVTSTEPRGTVLHTRSGRIDASRCWVDLWVSDGKGLVPPVEPGDDTGSSPANESPPVVEAPRIDCYALPEFTERTLAGVKRAVGDGPFEVRRVVSVESTLPRGRVLRVRSGPLGDDRCWLDLWVSAGPPPEPPEEPVPPPPEPPIQPPPEPPIQPPPEEPRSDLQPPERPPLPPPERPPERPPEPPQEPPQEPPAAPPPERPAEPPPLPPAIDCSRLPEFPEPTLAAARATLAASESFELREVIQEASNLPAGTVLRRAAGPLADGRCWMDLWISDGSFERKPPPPGFDWRWVLLVGTVLLAGATLAWRRLRARRRKSSEGGAAEVELRARLETGEARAEGAEEGFAAPPLSLRARLEPGTGPDIEFEDGGNRP